MASIGRCLSFDSSLSPTDARAVLALPNDNLATKMTPFTIPKGTTILLGDVALQTGTFWAGSYATGGGVQVFVSDSSILIKMSP